MMQRKLRVTPLALTAMMVSVLALTACNRDPILQGTRFPVRAPLEESTPVEGQPDPQPGPDRPANQSAPISLPGMISNADWGQRGGNAAHLAPHGTLSAAPELVWQVAIGKGNSYKNRISAAPVVAGGVVFVMDAMSEVTAVSVTGQKLWQADLTASFDAGGGVSGGGLAAADGRLYATTGYGEVVALDAASGAVVWRQRLGATPSGAPAVSGNHVYVMGDDSTAWALNTANGRVAWQLSGADALDSFHYDGGAAPAVEGGRVIFPFASGILMAAETGSGTAQWTAAVSGQRLGRAYANAGDVTGDPVLTGGVMYVGTQGGRTGAYALSTGERLWTAEEGALNPPVVAGGAVFVVNDEGRLVRLAAKTGETVWAVDLPYFKKVRKARKLSAITANFGPVLAGGHLVVVSSDGVLRSFNAQDGSLAGQAEIPGGAATPPALAQGLLFVVNTKGQLLAFR